MPTPWSQVAQSPQYQALPPDQQEAARQQYFSQVVAPQVGSDPNALAQAKSAFDAQYGPKTDTTSPFGAAVQKQVAIAQAEDAQSPSLSQKAGDAITQFADAEKHHLANGVLGLSQLVGHGITSAANAVLPADSDMRQRINATNTNFDTNLAQREKQYQASVPNTGSANAGAVAGEVAPWFLDAPAKGLQSLGNVSAKLLPDSLPLLQKVASGATQGAAVAATQPVTNTSAANPSNSATPSPSFAQQKAEQMGIGAATGGLVPVISQGVGNIYQLGRHIFNPGSVAAQNIAEKLGTSPDILQKLDSAQSSVPGVQLTSAQAAPSASAVGAEKAMGNMPAFKQQLVERQTQNNQARVNAVQQLAGDDAAYAAAKDARANAPLPNGQTIQQYQQSLPSTLTDPTDILASIDKLKNSGLGARPTISNALDAIKGAISSRLDANGKIPADVLDSIRQNANDFLVSPTGKQASAQEKAGVQPIKAKIIDTLDAASPGYRDYLATFADKSTPLNTMDAARSILDRADNHPLNSAGAAPLSLNDINRGLAQIDKGRYGISPQAQSTLEAIQDSLKKEGISNSIRTPGSDTMYNLNAQGSLPSAILGPNLGGPTGKTRLGAAALGSLIGQHFGGLEGAAAGAGLGAFINKGADFVNNRIMDQYTKGLLNPQDAATMIRAYLSGNSGNATKLLAKYPNWNALLSTQTAGQVGNGVKPPMTTSKP